MNSLHSVRGLHSSIYAYINSIISLDLPGGTASRSKFAAQVNKPLRGHKNILHSVCALARARLGTRQITPQ